MSGRLIEIFLPDSEIPTYRHGRIANRAIQAVTAARSELNRLTSEEAGRGGLYLLVNDDEESGVSVYVGRSENVAARLADHNRGSNVIDGDGAPADFSRVIVFFGDDWQTVAHRMWLEAKLIEAMRAVSWVTVLNKRQEQAPNLNPAQASIATEVFEDIRLLMPVLGLDVLERISPSIKTSHQQADENGQERESPEGESFELDFAGIHANIVVDGDRFIALSGSGFSLNEADALQSSYKHLRSRLLTDGGVSRSGEGAVLSKDVEFRSASAVGSTLTGQPLQALDRIVRSRDKQSLRQWLAAKTPTV